MSTFTATAQPQAEPPYVALAYNTIDNHITTFNRQDSSKNIVSVDITRDGTPVRISRSPSPAPSVSWKDYDAPFGVQVTYVATVGVAQAPTGTVSEDWTGTLSSKGWTSITNVSQAASVMRTNLCPNPSFEVSTANWAAYSDSSDATIARTTSQAYLGTASLDVIPAPATVSNFCPNPSFEVTASGWTAGSGTNTVSRVARPYIGSWSLQVATDVIAPGGTLTSYANSPMMTSIVAGRTYYFGFTAYFDTAATTVGANTTCVLRWYNSSNVQIGGDVTLGPASAGRQVWTSRAFSAKAPSGADRCQIFPGMSIGSGAGGGVALNWLLDRVYCSEVNAYFDGSSTDTSTYRYSWVGTVGNSRSIRETVVTNAGASVSGITTAAGRKVTASLYTKLGSSSTTVYGYFVWTKSDGTTSTSTAVSLGTANTTWTRFSLTETAPASTTSAQFFVYYSSLGWDIHAYIDAVLIEESNLLRPYFDGSNNELPASTSLGAWSAAWTGTSGLSTSTASYNHTIKPSGTPSSLTRTFSFAASAVKFFGLGLPSSGASVTATLNMSGTSLVISAVRDSTTTTVTMTMGATSAQMVLYSTFTGELDLNFSSGNAYLVHVDSGTTINIPLTSAAVVTSIAFSMVSGGIIMPLTLVPGLVITTESLSATVTMTPDDAWLIHPYTPALSMKVDAGQGCDDVFVTVDSARQLTRSAPTSLLQPIGSRRMIAISLGPRKDPVWDLELSTKTGEAYDAVEDLFSDASPLRFDYADALWYTTYYRWTGTPNASTSEKLQDGAVVRTNLATNPNMVGTTGYTGGAASLSAASNILTITPSSASTDSYASVGGDLGAFRLGMQAGHTYTVSATINTPSAQGGTVDAAARRIRFFYRNAAGTYVGNDSEAGPTTGSADLSVTVAIPADATEAFIRLYNGASTGNGTVEFSRLVVEEAPSAEGYFDGSSVGSKGCSRDMRIPKGWYSPGDLTEERDMEDWRSPLRRWSTTMSPVSAPTTIPQG